MAEARRRTTPSLRKPEHIVQLRAALQAAHFDFRTVRTVLGADETLTMPPHTVPFVARRLDAGPLSTLIRLFLVNAPVSTEQAARALAPLSLADATALGVITLGRSRVHGALRILPAAEGWFAADLDSEDPTDLPADFVMNVTESTRMLGHLTIRRPVELALDVGTGCGYHAVLAARHAGRVIATDVNPRALAFTGFNALLNGTSNVECVLGDRFAPVEGQRFDLIVSNPPFVVSPDRSFVYRDSGLGGDRVSHDLVTEAAQYLRPGGLATVLVSWVHDPDESRWSDPLQQWVADSGCDAWLLRKGSYDPLAYAVMWNQRLAMANQLQRYSDSVDRWLRYFERAGIQALGYGAVILRQRGGAGSPRIRLDELPEKGLGNDTAVELDRLLDVQDWLAETSADALLAYRLGLPPEHRLEQTLHWADGRFQLREATLLRERGLRPRAELDPPMLALLAQVDGTRTIGEILAAAPGGGEGAQSDAWRANVLGVIRDLIGHGFLVVGQD
jgi:SAM-dependent methyltransferase